MISRLIRCDVHRIEAANPYDYEKTVARNVREQEANARPRIKNPLRSIGRLRRGAACKPDLERVGLLTR